MPLINVKCTYIIQVEVSEDEEDGYSASFDIEENHCPGTGLVGRAFEEHYKRHDTGELKAFCWACALQGTNEIVD